MTTKNNGFIKSHLFLKKLRGAENFYTNLISSSVFILKRARRNCKIYIYIYTPEADGGVGGRETG